MQRFNSGGNFTPGVSQTANYGQGMFNAANQQAIAQQEQLLRNPQQQQQPGELHLNQQQATQLKQAISTLQQGANQHYQNFQRLQAFSNSIMNAFNAMCDYAAQLEKCNQIGQAQAIHANAFLAYAQELEKMVQLGNAQAIHATAFAQELAAKDDMLQVLRTMLTDPNYLIAHAFAVWERSLGGDVQALNANVSPAYMQLVANVEEKYKNQTGRYTPLWTQHLQSRINAQNSQSQQNPQQPFTLNTPNGVQPNIGYIDAFAKNLQVPNYDNSNLANQINRLHNSRRRG